MRKSAVGEWAKEKLDRLGKYLSAYTTIMRKRRWCRGYYYVDAFAGTGKHELRSRPPKSNVRNLLFNVASFGQRQEEQELFVAGSPRVALDIKHPFTGYIFIERSPARIAALKSLQEEYGDSRRIYIRQTDCNKYLRDQIVSNPQIDWTKHRALVFLDPFGMQVPWSTLESLGGTKAIEIFLNFPVPMAIQRLLPRDPEKLTAERRKMLDEYFGSPDWFNIIYRSRTTLFGEDAEEKAEQSTKRLLKWYRDRLRKAFGHVSKAALIRNTRKGHLYYLLLASPNPTGVKIANDVLSAGEIVQ
jgi:three-Cys-motif partner protein